MQNLLENAVKNVTEDAVNEAVKNSESVCGEKVSTGWPLGRC